MIQQTNYPAGELPIVGELCPVSAGLAIDVEITLDAPLRGELRDVVNPAIAGEEQIWCGGGSLQT